MKRLKSFLTTAILGGLTVLLPGAVILIVFSWIFDKLANLIDPLTHVVRSLLGNSAFSYYVAQLVVLTCLVVLCFLTGVLQRTRLGQIIFESLETAMRKLPGYALVKETIQQFTQHKKSPFSAVVVARIFEAQDVWVTGFITSRHDNGWCTIFVPTGPNPTTGGIFHLPPERFKAVSVSVESAMRSIISCGAGSQELVKQLPKE